MFEHPKIKFLCPRSMCGYPSNYVDMYLWSAWRFLRLVDLIAEIYFLFFLQDHGAI